MLTGILWVAFVSLTNTGFGQGGFLDASFGTGGVVITEVGTGNSVGTDIAIQTDGKILICGYTSGATVPDFAVARYNINGTLDLSFDTDGIVTTSFGGDDFAKSVKVQTDGKILVAGYFFVGVEMDFAVARYNTDGSLDVSFDTDGKFTYGLGGLQESGSEVLIQDDGKIVIAGTAVGGDGDIMILRLDLDGSLDATFDGDGVSVVDFSGTHDVTTSAVLQSDGKIVITGYHYDGISGEDILLTRFNTDGTIDNTFNSVGYAFFTGFPGDDLAFSVALQADGKIVACGSQNSGIGDGITLVRYNSDGSPDNSFDTDGGLITNVGAVDDVGYSVLTTSDGKILVGGKSENGTNYDLILLRYNDDGTLDNTFDGDGVSVTDYVGTDEEVNAIALQTDGKIIAGGYTYGATLSDLTVARFFNSGTIDIHSGTNENPFFTTYPNPSTGAVHVVLKSKGASEVSVVNSLGQTILSETVVGSTTLNIPERGIFMVVVNDGNTRYSSKIAIR